MNCRISGSDPDPTPAYLLPQAVGAGGAVASCSALNHWGNFGSVTVGATRRRLSFFVMVLCYSRLLCVEFTLSEGLEQFLTGHRHAFEFFGGLPAKIMIDYVARNIIDLLFPPAICALPGEKGRYPRELALPLGT